MERGWLASETGMTAAWYCIIMSKALRGLKDEKNRLAQDYTYGVFRDHQKKKRKKSKLLVYI